jgi:transcriptional regulator with XRE-family HTH domain
LRRIKELRQERGLSQQRLAAMADIDKVTLIRIETGRGNPTVETLGKLATALDVEMADLFPKGQAPLPFEELEPVEGGIAEEERRARWDAAVHSARQLRERGHDRMKGLLSAWRESRDRQERLAARRDYLDEMGELLQEAYETETALMANIDVGLQYRRRNASGSTPNPGWEEVREASRFYGALLEMVQGAGLSVRRGAGAHEVQNAA